MKMGAKGGGGGSSVERIALPIKLQGKSPMDDSEPNYNFFHFLFFCRMNMEVYVVVDE